MSAKHFCCGLLAAGTLLPLSAAHAALVTGPWTGGGRASDNGLQAGSENTASPIVGDNSDLNADDEAIDAAFTAIVLANNGDRITLSGSVEILGSIDTAAAAAAGQFRYGLFLDDVADGTTDNEGWLGYYVNNESSGTNGSITRKPAANTSLHVSGTGGAAVGSASETLQRFDPGTYSFSLSIERVNNDLRLTTSLAQTVDPDGPPPDYNFNLTLTDLAASVPTYTFDRVGFLLGGSLDADQARFSNIDVTFTPIPEPGSLGLLAAGVIGVLARGRTK